ncbi:MAG: hypothetical protein ACO1OD_11100 [Croceibacterium sp.]
MMIKRLLSGYDMALALNYYKKGDIKSARYHLDKYFERGSTEDPVAVAFDATLLILESRSKEAAGRFAHGRAMAERKLADPDATYVREYCSYYECLIANGADCELHKDAALGVTGSPKVLRWLSFPVGDF